MLQKLTEYQTRMLAVADKIENLEGDEFFDMATWWNSEQCGTVACIAGWTVIMHGSLSGEGGDRIQRQARLLLGLDMKTAFRLFMGKGFVLPDGELSLSCITPAIAARVLRNLATTGEVDWSV